MKLLRLRGAGGTAAALIALACFAPAPASSQTTEQLPQDQQPPAAAQVEDVQDPAAAQTEADAAVEEDAGPDTDIISRNTVSIQLDARLVMADGHESWIDRGFSKARFAGTDDGDFRIRPYPVEGFLIWQPRFFRSLSGNVSAGWQNDQEHDIDLIEAYLSYIPENRGKVSFSAKGGLYWPEISLEHATGGAWSTVYTLTPSAINSWIGEEVKVLGLEGTLSVSAGEHEIAATGGIFGYNDTSGTLLSFRGWALHDAKATAFGHFKLPPLNPFMTTRQENRTRSLIELDDRAGFYGRLEWRPPAGFVVNAFYYDNRGDPEEFNDDLQWGWRTRFLNVGVSADIGPDTRLIAQGMTGSTIMGFPVDDQEWVDTRFRSAFVLVSHNFEKFTVSGRAEAFGTNERGSLMKHDEESEDGWAVTSAVRMPIGDYLTGFAEAMVISSERGTRNRVGRGDRENQSVFQLGLRLKL